MSKDHGTTPAAARARSTRRQDEAGQTLILFALSLTLLMGFLALAVDLGYGYSQRRLMQNVADTTALAGTAMLGKSYGQNTGDFDVANAVESIQDNNMANAAEQSGFTLSAKYVDSSGSDIGTPGGSGAPPANATGVHTTASRTFATLFGIFTVSSSNSSGGSGGSGGSGSTTTASEIQRVTINGNPTSGTFTLSFKGSTTVSLGPEVGAAAVQSALEALPTIGAGNVSVSGSLAGYWDVTFTGTLAGQNQPQMSATSLLIPTSTVTVSVNTVTDGGTTTRATRNITASGDATAQLKYVTGVSTTHPDFAPYIVWEGSLSCKAAIGKSVVFWSTGYMGTQVDVDCSGQDYAEPNWRGNSNDFRGYLHDASGIIRTGQVLSIDTSGGNALGGQPTDMLTAHKNSGRPIILPVISQESGNGSHIDLTVIGFAYVKVTNVCTNSGGGCQDTGIITRYAMMNLETGGTTPTNPNPAQAVVLSN